MIAQKTSLAFFSNIFQKGIGFISLYFVAHYMGPKALGIIAYATAYIAMFATFADLGFGTAHVKRISEGKDLGKCNGTFLVVKVSLTVVMAIIVLISIKLFQEKSLNEDDLTVLYIVLASTILINLSTVIISTFTARRETAKEKVPAVIQRIINVSGRVFVAVMGFSVVYLAVVDFISAIVLLVILILLFRVYPIRKPDFSYLKSYTTFAIPIMFIGFLTNIAMNIDKVIIKHFWDITNVGYYSAAQSISSLLSFVWSASMMLTFSKLSSLNAEGNIKNFRIFAQRAERFNSMILFPAFFYILIFSEPLCRVLLGKQFIITPTILVVLSAVAVVNGITQPYAQQPAATNRVMLQAKISCIVLGLNIILDFLLVPEHFLGLDLPGMGPVGAAVATLISIGVGSVVYRYYAFRISKSNFNWRIVLHAISGGVMGIILYNMSNLMKVISLYHLALFAFLSAGIYIGIMVLLGEFKKEDFNLFVYISNPAQMKKYITEEMKSKS